MTLYYEIFPKQKPRVIKYRSYRKFNCHDFGNDLQANLGKLNLNGKYIDFGSIFINALNKHAPLKEKLVRANNAPYINKNLSKAIMNRSRLKNKFVRELNKENKAAYNKQSNYWVNLLKKGKKEVL